MKPTGCFHEDSKVLGMLCTIMHVLQNTTLGGAVHVMDMRDLYIYGKIFPADISKMSCSKKSVY